MKEHEDPKHLPRRPRRLRAIYGRSRPLFFVTICTANRVTILANMEVHNLFIEFCRVSPQKAEIWVGKYVLMPDHVHVFVSAEDSSALSRWVGSLKKFLPAHWRRNGLKAPFWQEGFFDHVLRNSESYSEKWAYVEQNPVRAGLVKEVDEWPFAGEIKPLKW